MNFLWISDPWATLDHARDTTLRLHQAALSLGYGSQWADARSIRFENGRVLLDESKVSLTRDGEFRIGASRTLDYSKFRGQAHYRVDPPVDEAYLHPLRLLGMPIEAKSRRILNPPSLLALGSEKLLSLAGPGSSFPSIVASDQARLVGFASKEEAVVIKPLHSAQSKGVEKWIRAQGELGLVRLLDSATKGFTIPVLIQKFLPEILNEGELRLWFAGGKFLASARKRPLPGDFRVQVDLGSPVEKGAPSAVQKKLIRGFEKQLRSLGAELAAIDLVGNKVLDFNVTSPGLLMQMEEVTGECLSEEVIRRLAKRR